ncbi:DUF5675 family protein [Xanthomarina gelatinilytica]|uniref:DUF5675 family protein n=1 Tax=Xanthomarina gelatinilytica TaxID=1137281 RepID=UPI003AA80854
MELVLTRVYKRGGTNGTLTLNGHFVCFTIELPWKENRQNSSCIPEGNYELRSRTSAKFHNHLEILDVPNRSYILIHPANNAITQLRGCIAPVNLLTGIGTGINSKLALQKLLSLYHQARDKNEKVILNINSNRYEYLKQIQKSHS